MTIPIPLPATLKRKTYIIKSKMAVVAPSRAAKESWLRTPNNQDDAAIIELLENIWQQDWKAKLTAQEE